MVGWRWFNRLIAWDGVLPLAISAVPAAIVLLFPRNDVAEVSAVILVPVVAALMRSVIGAQQVRQLCDGESPAARQLALAAAIVLLLLFEGLVTMLTFADDEPMSAWAYTVCLYLGYLAAIVFAFAPRAAQRWS